MDLEELKSSSLGKRGFLDMAGEVNFNTNFVNKVSNEDAKLLIKDFTKGKWFLPQKTSNQALYDAALASKVGLAVFIPKIENMKSEDYDIDNRGYYKYKKTPRHTNRYATYQREIIALFVEEICFQKVGSPLWCEGRFVDLDYHLILLENISRKDYDIVKSDTEVDRHYVISGKKERQYRDMKEMCSKTENLLNKELYRVCMLSFKKKELEEEAQDLIQETHDILQKAYNIFNEGGMNETLIILSKCLVNIDGDKQVMTSREKYTDIYEKMAEDNPQKFSRCTYLPIPLSEQTFTLSNANEVIKKFQEAVFPSWVSGTNVLIPPKMDLKYISEMKDMMSDAVHKGETNIFEIEEDDTTDNLNGRKYRETLLAQIKTIKEHNRGRKQYAPELIGELLESCWIYNNNKGTVEPARNDLGLPSIPNGLLKAFRRSSLASTIMDSTRKDIKPVKTKNLEKYLPSETPKINIRDKNRENHQSDRIRIQEGDIDPAFTTFREHALDCTRSLFSEGLGFVSPFYFANIQKEKDLLFLNIAYLRSRIEDSISKQIVSKFFGEGLNDSSTPPKNYLKAHCRQIIQKFFESESAGSERMKTIHMRYLTYIYLVCVCLEDMSEEMEEEYKNIVEICLDKVLEAFDMLNVPDPLSHVKYVQLIDSLEDIHLNSNGFVKETYRSDNSDDEGFDQEEMMRKRIKKKNILDSPFLTASANIMHKTSFNSFLTEIDKFNDRSTFFMVFFKGTVHHYSSQWYEFIDNTKADYIAIFLMGLCVTSAETLSNVIFSYRKKIKSKGYQLIIKYAGEILRAFSLWANIIELLKTGGRVKEHPKIFLTLTQLSKELSGHMEPSQSNTMLTFMTIVFPILHKINPDALLGETTVSLYHVEI